MQIRTTGIADGTQLLSAIVAPARVVHVEALRGTWHSPDLGFADILRLARRVTGTEFASVTLVEADRVVVLACDGWGSHPMEKALTDALCAHTVALGCAMAVNDARSDPTLRDLSAVTALGAVAYLGVPIFDYSMIALGTLCVLDRRTRAWNAEHVDALSDLAGWAIERVIARHTKLSPRNQTDLS